jgi:DNA (cytosine-5)-methyltransferase 1
MNELHLFAGAGGGILGGILLGHTTVCAVEIEPYCRKVLLQRQRDGILPKFPIWDDVCTFDGKPWRGKVDVICGGFPCQDISVAGKGAGITGERSGLWGEMARIIREVGPPFVFVENSPMLTVRGLGVVLGDLAEMGYDAKWGVLGAINCGAPHQRERIWIMAYPTVSDDKTSQRSGRSTQGTQRQSRGSGICPHLAHSMRFRIQRKPHSPSLEEGDTDLAHYRRVSWWKSDPADLPQSQLGRVVNGVAHRVDRLKAIGNGQVSAVAALAWRTLS